MKQILSIAWLCLLLPGCSGSGSPPSDTAAVESLSGRLSQSHGYEVDDKGNWVPRHNKRSQFEGRGDSPYFSGGVDKKQFDTNQLQKGSWWGAKEIERPAYVGGDETSLLTQKSGLDGRQASIDHRLNTPARIERNTHPTGIARESGAGSVDKPSDAETDLRRRVFVEPEIIDYKQQRELSIRESKDLLGR